MVRSKIIFYKKKIYNIAKLKNILEFKKLRYIKFKSWILILLNKNYN